jgi:hypothetical protein
LRGQEKVTKKKAAQKLVGIFNSNSLTAKEKQAFRELGRCSAFFRPQTSAHFNPVFISLLGCVRWD